MANTIDLDGVKVPASDWSLLRGLSRSLLGATYVDIPQRAARKLAVKAAMRFLAQFRLELNQWEREHGR